MSDPFKSSNVGKFDSSDPSYLKHHSSDSIDDEKSDHNIPFRGKSVSSQNLLFARAMQLLEDGYTSKDDTDISHLDAGDRDLYTLLLNLLQSLTLLSQKNNSGDIKFMHSLSSNWHDLLISVSRRRQQKDKASYVSDMNKAFEEIENYKEDGALLGYYLKEHRNSDWFPRPYINMLSKLHEEFQENGEKSTLYVWIEQISDLLEMIKNPE